MKFDVSKVDHDNIGEVRSLNGLDGSTDADQRVVPGRVSVIIANYNYDKFVGEAIESALNLDWDDVEVIVVDDGSTDQSRKEIARYEGRIQIIFQPNSTQRVARNNGFERSTGSMVIHLDSDDVLDPSIIREVNAVWGPRVSKVQVQMQLIDADGCHLGRVSPAFRPVPTPQEVRHWLVETTAYPTPPGSGNVYARWFLNQIFPLDEFCGPATDSACLAMAPLLGDVLTLDKPLVGYRIHDSNTSDMTKDASSYSRAIERARRRHLYTLKECGALDSKVDVDAALRRSRPLLQLRIAAHRLTPELPGLPGDSWIRLCMDALRSPAHPGPETMRVRTVIVAWCLIVMLSPRKFAQVLIVKRYSRRGEGPRLTRLQSILASLRADR